MSGNFFILTAVCASIFFLFLYLKKGKRPPRGSSSARHSPSIPKTIPPWLENSLHDYENQALAYYLHQASLKEDLSQDALAVQEKLEMAVYVRPSLLLFDARTKAGCSDSEMEGYLRLYYQKKTGNAMVVNIDAVYTVQEMILQMAQDEVKSLQGECKNR